MGSGTTNYGLSRPTVGIDNNTCGTHINTALETVDTQLYNKTDRRDSKGVSITLNFAGNNITDASTSSEFKNYTVGDRLYITNASNNNANRGEFYVNGVTSDNVLVMKKSDTSTDANFTTENNVSSTVSLIVREPFTRHVFSHLTGEIRLFASTTLATIQALGSISDGGATRYAWLACNGQAVSKTVYKDLYEVIKNGTSAGIFGESGGNFYVPDLRGRVPAGDDTMTGSDASRLPTAGDHIGESGGSHEHTIGSANLPTHTHDQGTLDIGDKTLTASSTDSGHTHTVSNFYHSSNNSGGQYAVIQQNRVGVFSNLSIPSSTANITTTISPGTHDHSISGSTGNGGFANSAISNLQPYQVIGSYIIAT